MKTFLGNDLSVIYDTGYFHLHATRRDILFLGVAWGMARLFVPDHRHFIHFLKAAFQPALCVQWPKNKMLPICITHAVNNCRRQELVKMSPRNPRALQHSSDVKTTVTNVALHVNYGPKKFGQMLQRIEARSGRFLRVSADSPLNQSLTRCQLNRCHLIWFDSEFSVFSSSRPPWRKHLLCKYSGASHHSSGCVVVSRRRWRAASSVFYTKLISLSCFITAEGSGVKLSPAGAQSPAEELQRSVAQVEESAEMATINLSFMEEWQEENHCWKQQK